MAGTINPANVVIKYDGSQVVNGAKLMRTEIASINRACLVLRRTSFATLARWTFLSIRTQRVRSQASSFDPRVNKSLLNSARKPSQCDGT